jgi:hypothetical protein
MPPTKAPSRPLPRVHQPIRRVSQRSPEASDSSLWAY